MQKVDTPSIHTSSGYCSSPSIFKLAVTQSSTICLYVHGTSLSKWAADGFRIKLSSSSGLLNKPWRQQTHLEWPLILRPIRHTANHWNTNMTLATCTCRNFQLNACMAWQMYCINSPPVINSQYVETQNNLIPRSIWKIGLTVHCGQTIIKQMHVHGVILTCKVRSSDVTVISSSGVSKDQPFSHTRWNLTLPSLGSTVQKLIRVIYNQNNTLLTIWVKWNGHEINNRGSIVKIFIENQLHLKYCTWSNVDWHTKIINYKLMFILTYENQTNFTVIARYCAPTILGMATWPNKNRFCLRSANYILNAISCYLLKNATKFQPAFTHYFVIQKQRDLLTDPIIACPSKLWIILLVQCPALKCHSIGIDNIVKGSAKTEQKK